MKNTLTILIATAALACQSAPAAAVNGEFDGDGHPNVGTMVAEWRAAGQLEPYCTGTLIAPAVFLTAAHCTEGLHDRGITPDDIYVQFDPVFTSQATLHPATYTVNPGYQMPGGKGGFADPHDLAAVILDAPVAIAPAPLPPRGMLDGRDLRDAVFTSVGYGVTRADKTRGFGAFESDGTRNAGERSFRALTPSFLQLSGNPATGDAGGCYGDSGGPNFLDGVLVALISSGDAVCRAMGNMYRLDTDSARAYLARYLELP